MQTQGRGRLRVIVSVAVALVVTALAPAAASADVVAFSSGSDFIDVFPNETGTSNVAITISYGGSDHLKPGTQVQLSPGPLDPGFAAETATVTVPSDWGFGKTLRADALASYTASPLLKITETHLLTWNPTSYTCTLGGTSCLNVSGSRRIDTRTHPHNVTNLESDAGVVEANVTWDHSLEHSLLTRYVLTRLRLNSSGVPVEAQGFPLSSDTTSFHDEGLLPGTRYCWRVRSEKIVPIGEFGNQVIPAPTPEPEVCKTTGTNPPAPASGPSGPSLDADGQFDLTWDPAPGTGITYELEHKDANDADWSPLATGLTDPSYSADEGEGTWRYRVRAHGPQRGVSDWVQGSASVKVDTTAPSAPVATTDPAAPAYGDWFANSVTVSFGGSTDPDLPDHSAGSGVDAGTYSASQTFDTSGLHTAAGTVKDVAEHESAAADKTVKVDATAPKLAVSGCPTGPVLERTVVTVTWTASDDESGLATPAGDDIDVDTSQPGPKTVDIPTASDHVGHDTTTEPCEFDVYANTAPDAPTGLVDANSPRRDGEFDLRWDEATDPDLGAGDSITYTVEQRDADSDWTTAAEGLTALSHHVNVADGTWQFRVRAVDSFGANSDWANFAPVKVDRGKPTAPTMTTDPADAFGGWFKDSVTVSFDGSNDPALDDGSDGSGVAGNTAPRMFSDTGTYEVSGTATDHAGNESDPTEATVNVDADAPTTTASCPTDGLTVGQPFKVAWTAEDEGSGLATPASGELTLDTSSPGSHTTSADPVRDRVGHQTAGASCTYTVAYKFAGFSAPINGTAVNSGKTGRAYPVKWRLQRYDGSLISDADAQALVAEMSAGQKQVSCSSFTLMAEDLLEESSTGDTSLRYDAAADQFIYNYKAPATAGCYVLGIRKADGHNTRQLNFTFTR